MKIRETGRRALAALLSILLLLSILPAENRAEENLSSVLLNAENGTAELADGTYRVPLTFVRIRKDRGNTSYYYNGNTNLSSYGLLTVDGDGYSLQVIEYNVSSTYTELFMRPEATAAAPEGTASNPWFPACAASEDWTGYDEKKLADNFTMDDFYSEAELEYEPIEGRNAGYLTVPVADPEQPLRYFTWNTRTGLTGFDVYLELNEAVSLEELEARSEAETMGFQFPESIENKDDTDSYYGWGRASFLLSAAAMLDSSAKLQNEETPGAVFTLSETGLTDPDYAVSGIWEHPTQSGDSDQYRGKYQNAQWQAVEIGEDGSFALSFSQEELIYGKELRCSLANGSFRYCVLLPFAAEVKDVTITDEATGVSVSASSLYLPENAQMTVTKDTDGSTTEPLIWEELMKAADPARASAYNISMRTASGESLPIKQYQNGKTISIPIDEDMDISTLTVVVYFLEVIPELMATNVIEIRLDDNYQIEDGRLVITKDTIPLDGEYYICIYNPTDTVNLADYEDGVYEVQASFMYRTDPGATSMANDCLEHTATVVISENGAKKEVYLWFKEEGMLMSGDPEGYYVGGLWSKVVGGNYIPETAELYDYVCLEDGTLKSNAGYNPYTGYPCYRYMKLTLDDRALRTSGELAGQYSLAIISPIMAALNGLAPDQIQPDDLYCRLKFTDIEKIGELSDIGTSIEIPTYQKSVLMRGIGRGEAYLENALDYTAESIAALQEQVDAGRAYYETLIGSEATAAESARIKEFSDHIESAITGLQAAEGVDKSELTELIAQAEAKSGDDYTATSWQNLQTALTAAKAAEADENATQSTVNKQCETLKAALDALEEKDADLDVPSRLADGTYTVPVKMLKADNDSDSMGNASMEQTATLIVKDGKAALDLSFHSMVYLNLTGYLAEYEVLSGVILDEYGYPMDGYTVHNPTVKEYYDLYDGYNDPDTGTDARVKGKKYPKVLSFDVTLPDVSGFQTVWTHVYVPVMGEFESGDQFARLRIDYSGIKLVELDDPDEPDDPLEELRAQFEETRARMDSLVESDYTAESWTNYQTYRTMMSVNDLLSMYDSTPEMFGEAELTGLISEMETAMSYLVKAEEPSDPLEELRTQFEETRARMDSLVESDYTAESWTNYQTYRTMMSVDELLSMYDSMPEMFGEAELTGLISEMETAMSYLVKAEEPEDPLKELRTQFEETRARMDSLVESDYTAESWTNYQTYRSMMSVNDLLSMYDSTPEMFGEAELTGLISEMETAMSYLVKAEEPEDPLAGLKTELQEKQAAMDALAESDYTAESWAQYQEYYNANLKDDLETYYANPEEYANEETLTELIRRMEEAMSLLVEYTEPVLADGVYTIDAVMRHANNRQNSMGNAALKKPVTLVVENGQAYLQMNFVSLTIQSLNGYLGELGYLTYDGKTTPSSSEEVYPAEVLSVYEVRDSFNDLENGTDSYMLSKEDSRYPKVLAMPIALEDEEVWVRVYVPVMEALQSGSGLQFARLQLDWSTVTEKAEVDKTALQEALNAAEEKLESADSYPAELVSALQAEVAAALNVYNDPYAEQDEVDAQTAALNDAIDAMETGVDTSALVQSIENARIEAAKTDIYTPATIEALNAEIAAAEELLNKEGLTAEEVETETILLEVAVQGLIQKADKSALQANYEIAAAIENDGYSNWDEFQEILAAAKAVLDDENASQDAVNEQTTILVTAVNNLESAVDKSELRALVDQAKEIDLSNCADAVAAFFQSVIDSAEAVLSDPDASEAQVEKHVQLLMEASEALIQKEEENTLYNGVYEINGTLWNATNPEQTSMGDAAITKPMQLIVDGDDVTLRMDFHSLTITGLEGYLGELNYFPGYTDGDIPYDINPTETEAESYYDEYDYYNDPDSGVDSVMKGRKYPKTILMPVDLDYSEFWVQVYVPVMEEISEGSGRQYARLEIDWDSLNQIEGIETDKEALTAALDTLRGLDASGGTDGEKAILENAIAAGQFAVDNHNISQEAVDELTEALQYVSALFSQEQVSADKSELERAIAAADEYLNAADVTYSAATLRLLQSARDEAQRVYEKENATQTEVNRCVQKIDNAIQGLVAITTDKTELRKALDAMMTHLAATDYYTAASLEALQLVYDRAMGVYNDENATQEEINAQISTMNHIVTVLHRAEVDKTGLWNMYLVAFNMVNRDDLFTEKTLKTLQTEVTAAEAVLENENATQEQVNAQASALVAAVRGLEKLPANQNSNNGGSSNNGNNSGSSNNGSNGGSTDDDGQNGGSNNNGNNNNNNAGSDDDNKNSSTLDRYNLADGVYSITGKMVKIDKKTASMSNEAINHTVKLTVKKGKYYLTLDFCGLKYAGQFGYLGWLKYFKTGYSLDKYGNPTGSLGAATVDSVQKDSDGKVIEDSLGTNYPNQVTFPLIQEGVSDGYVPLQVFVPIMESISAGTGTQPVFLKLTWSTLKKTTKDDEAFEDNQSEIDTDEDEDDDDNSLLTFSSTLKSSGNSLSTASLKSTSSSLKSGTSSLKSSSSALKSSSSSLKSGTSALKNTVAANVSALNSNGIAAAGLDGLSEDDAYTAAGSTSAKTTAAQTTDSADTGMPVIPIATSLLAVLAGVFYKLKSRGLLFAK